MYIMYQMAISYEKIQVRVKRLQKYSSALYYVDFVSFNKLKWIFAKADLLTIC